MKYKDQQTIREMIGHRVRVNDYGDIYHGRVYEIVHRSNNDPVVRLRLDNSNMMFEALLSECTQVSRGVAARWGRMQSN